jgi:2,4-dienoyl-CoA reductase-like NADH-dependent reductase (Old Yellow Enzyme family)
LTLSALLFEPLQLRGLTLANRIVVEPMTQFSAPEGTAGDWHLMHLGQFAISGAGLVLTESTYVAPEARNTPLCLSLYNDEQEAAIGRIKRFYDAHGDARFGVQLCHAGRRASAKEPWLGGGSRSVEDGGYRAVAPSSIPLAAHWPSPRELGVADLDGVRDAFVSATRRALRAGADLIELHCAHGYLLHQFLSPLSNQRGDRYGDSVPNRMRFPLEVFEAVRSAWPAEKPLGVRVSATDWIPGGWDLDATVAFARELECLGCDFIDVSSGGLHESQRIVVAPGYQVPFAAKVKQAVKMKVVAVGLITQPQQAETILLTGQADLIGLARAMLDDPRWPWHAAQALGVNLTYPRQYERAHPSRRMGAGINAPGNAAPSATMTTMAQLEDK